MYPYRRKIHCYIFFSCVELLVQLPPQLYLKHPNMECAATADKQCGIPKQNFVEFSSTLLVVFDESKSVYELILFICS